MAVPVSDGRSLPGPPLAYDSDRREFYALLTRESAVGIFNEQGQLVRTLPLATPAGFAYSGVSGGSA